MNYSKWNPFNYSPKTLAIRTFGRFIVRPIYDFSAALSKFYVRAFARSVDGVRS